PHAATAAASATTPAVDAARAHDTLGRLRPRAARLIRAIDTSTSLCSRPGRRRGGGQPRDSNEYDLLVRTAAYNLEADCLIKTHLWRCRQEVRSRLISRFCRPATVKSGRSAAFHRSRQKNESNSYHHVGRHVTITAEQSRPGLCRSGDDTGAGWMTRP